MSHNRLPDIELMSLSRPKKAASRDIKLFSSTKAVPINILILPDALKINVSLYLPVADFFHYYGAHRRLEKLKRFGITTYPPSALNKQLPHILHAFWSTSAQPSLRQQAYNIISLASKIDTIISVHHQATCPCELRFNIPRKWLFEVNVWAHLAPTESKDESKFVHIERCVRERLDDINIKLAPVWGKIIHYDIQHAGIGPSMAIALSPQERGPALYDMRKLSLSLGQFGGSFQQVKNKVSHLYQFF